MSTRLTLIIGLALVLIAVVVSLAAYNWLPDPMASHWDFNDEVNGHISRFWGAFLMPIIAIAMLGLFLAIPRIDPLKANIATFRPIFNGFILALMVFLFYLHLLTLLWNLGYQGFHMSTALMPGLGLIFIFAGLMMRQAKRNFFIGIRTPWTLSNDRVWDKTHRVGSVLFILCGVVAMFGVFLPGPMSFLLVIVPLMVVTTFLLGYSYWLYQEEVK
ncbi:MAG TPA: SdpI family protein [Anaerolineales bacterium]